MRWQSTPSGRSSFSSQPQLVGSFGNRLSHSRHTWPWCWQVDHSSFSLFGFSCCPPSTLRKQPIESFTLNNWNRYCFKLLRKSTGAQRWIRHKNVFFSKLTSMPCVRLTDSPQKHTLKMAVSIEPEQ